MIFLQFGPTVWFESPCAFSAMIRLRLLVAFILALWCVSVIIALYSLRGNDFEGGQQEVAAVTAVTVDALKQPLAGGARADQPRWDLWKEWVRERQVYPSPASKSLEMRELLQDMATRRIVTADVGSKGTQLKMFLILEGGQQVVFKPQR